MVSQFKTVIGDAINRYLEYPGLSEKDLMRKKVSFYWTLASASSVIVLTIFAYLIQATIIGYFGTVLIILYPLGIWLYTLKKYDLYNIIFLGAFIIIACIFIILCGGYLHSGGIIFVGLTCAFSSILSKNRIWSIALFGLYMLSILVIAVLDPYLTVHPDMTPGVNFWFFIINTIWMSATMIQFIGIYIQENTQIEEAEIRRVVELEKAKSNLYTGITHEFRTPLTLILGMAEQLASKNVPVETATQQIEKQGFKLLKLINQMLNMAKLDAGAMKVHYTHGDVVSFVKYLLESFESTARAHHIALSVESKIAELHMDYDAEKLEDIINNLVSNAIKFTKPGGRIKLTIDEVSEFSKLKVARSCIIAIEDTGIGIDPNNLSKIFERFYQAGEKHRPREGTGIGLSLVKEYIDMLGGKIEVLSKPGQGTQFRVWLPIIHTAKESDKTLTSDLGYSIEPATDLANDYLKAAHSSKPLVLIIEDNDDVAAYLNGLLKDDYSILLAQNGAEGFHYAIDLIPDIVISDVMMPVMGGIEFLKNLKSDLRTNHIPVILLTAKADIQSRLEGLKQGAEAYLTKPFNKEELFVRLQSLLDQRRVLQQHYAQLGDDTEATKSANTLQDQFMTKVRSIIDTHMDDEDFGVNALSRALNMSRTQLYRKFSALTNITVDKYIRKYRLRKAYHLLKTTDLNVTQAAIETGFSNSSYFSRAFREEFGINPSEIHSHHNH